MPFDPAQIPEDSTAEGHLDDTPIYEVLLGVLGQQATGRLTVQSPGGDNHMYFMQGRPVGVQLADFFHPLGQLLLELGRIDAPTFIRAQRLISEGNRLPGQVFMQLEVLDEDGLRDVLSVQANRKAEEFCRLGSRPFAFGRGLTFLSGFQSTPLDVYAVLYLAVRQQMGPASRTSWLEELSQSEIRLPAEQKALPAPLAVFGFGPPEERFLGRLKSGWQSVTHLVETGTLPNDDVAVLLRFLHILGRLQIRDKPAPAPAPPEVPDDVFSSKPSPPPPPRRKRPTEDREPQAPPGGATPPKSEAEAARPTKPRTRSGEGAAADSSSVIVAPDLMDEPEKEPPKKKKRRKRRSEPLPSVGQRAESETRKEKTHVGPLPSIMIEDD